MNKEHIPVITDREELYDKCENMEQLFDKYYLPLLDKHYSKTYELQQESQKLQTEKEQMNSLVNSCQEEIRRLKKQLEQYQEEVCILDMITDENIKYKNQQKEFIEYLEKTIVDSKAGSGQQYYYQQVLEMYKEIIGGKE